MPGWMDKLTAEVVSPIMAKLCVDAKFLLCPEPIRLLHQHIRLIAEQEIIELWATDPTTQRDVQQFCYFLGHDLLEIREQEDIWIFKIRKKMPVNVC